MTRKGTPVTPENKELARYIAKVFGGKPQVREWVHDTDPLTIDVLSCENRPHDGVTSYSTLGLSDVALNWGSNKVSARVELLGVCASDAAMFPNILSSAAFRTIRTRTPCYPGASMANYVAEYYESTTVPHLYFTAPFFWEDKLKSLQLETKKVSYLLAMPISNSEYSFLKVKGDEKLESLFEQAQIDIFDLWRKPVV